MIVLILCHFSTVSTPLQLSLQYLLEFLLQLDDTINMFFLNTLHVTIYIAS
ncbi:hypothetical protein GLYMA_10G267601v4 [Glycine max]|nr:hypothetical protein GLYMA_10G267601v4 [Glycine max]KAH1140247.1 hypothetical protein GYH30_029246 [Glycine max]